MTDPAVQALLDRAAILDVLARYCRGVDRCDAETLKSAYWPDALDDHGTFNGNAMEFVDGLVPALRGMDRTMHAISNMLIELTGETATAETYCHAYHEFSDPDGGKVEMVVGGRYLDRFEKRGGEWRIAHRLYVMDWNRNGPSTAEWEAGIYGQLRTRGGRWPDDPLYAELPRNGKADREAVAELSGSPRPFAQPLHHAAHGSPPRSGEDRAAIVATLALYAHALDRRAFDLLAHCFHPDATYRYAAIDGDWRHFVDAARAILAGCGPTHHQLGQALIALAGDTAHVETTFTAHHRVPADAPATAAFPGTGAAYDVVIGGRYVDRFERRAGRWAIAARTGLHDWRRDQPAADPGFADLPREWRGRTDPDDPGRAVGAAFMECSP